MIHLKRYKNFKNDKITIDWLSERITDKEFFEYLETNILNESLMNVFKDKFFSAIESLIDKVVELGFKIFDKFISMINFIKEKLDNLNPNVRKLIILTLTTLIIIFLSVSTLYASVNGEPLDIEKINMAIGLIKELESAGDLSNMDASRSLVYLIDLRDGKMTFQDVGDDAINIAKSALRTVDNIYKNELSEYSKSLIEKGEKTLEYFYKKSAQRLSDDGFKSSETILFKSK
jgi:hypothetical protein